jgi:hypothetical protein
MTMPTGIYLHKSRKHTEETKLKCKIWQCKKHNKPVDDISRFWSYVDIKGEDECWEYTGAKNKKGYGRFKFNGKLILSHRIAYELYFGRIPEGKQINHKCNNRPCCNPFHTYAGTNQDNMDDKVRANRQSRSSGSSNGLAKLTEKQVIDIRENKDNLSQGKLGKIYGVNHSTIGNILSGKTWKHVSLASG